MTVWPAFLYLKYKIQSLFRIFDLKILHFELEQQILFYNCKVVEDEKLRRMLLLLSFTINTNKQTLQLIRTAQIFIEI
jgi:hypothetical protein